MINDLPLLLLEKQIVHIICLGGGSITQDYIISIDLIILELLATWFNHRNDTLTSSVLNIEVVIPYH